jgi:hypothetical protein
MILLQYLQQIIMLYELVSNIHLVLFKAKISLIVCITIWNVVLRDFDKFFCLSIKYRDFYAY